MKNIEGKQGPSEYKDPPPDTTLGDWAFHFWLHIENGFLYLPLLAIALHFVGIGRGDPELPSLMRELWLAGWVALLPLAILRVSMRTEKPHPKWTAALHGLSLLPAPLLFVFNVGVGHLIALPIVAALGFTAHWIGYVLYEPEGRHRLRAAIYLAGAATFLVFGMGLFMIEPPEGSATVAVLVWSRYLLALPLAILVLVLGQAALDTFRARHATSAT